jgi:HAD superfamily hydrolase (TIGR01509 family)
MRLQAVLFDLWGTLITDPPERSRPRQLWRAKATRAALAANGCDLSLEDVDRSLIDAMASLGTLQDQGLDLTSNGRADLFSDMIERRTGHAVPREALMQIEAVITDMPVEHQPLLAPHAVETLADIKALGLGTGLVSNAGFTTAPQLRRILGDYGLLPHFDVLVFSDEAGAAKPAARLFQQAATALGLEPGACAFVGDSPHNDIGGAIAAGMLAVQIGARRLDGIAPHVRIEGLEQLLPALETQAGMAGPARLTSAG